MNRGCPFLHVVPGRPLLGIEQAVRSSTDYEYLEVRANRFEGKAVVMSPWIEHRVRIKLFRAHRLTQSWVIANVLTGLVRIFSRHLVDNLARVAEVLPLHGSRVGIVCGSGLLIRTIALECQHLESAAHRVFGSVRKTPRVGYFCEINALDCQDGI